MTNPSAIVPRFDRLASVYRWLEWGSFGPYLARSRRTWLNRLANSRRALVIGDGDGRFTARLLRANPVLEIDAVDASPAMLQALVRRAGPHGCRVHPCVVDARELRLSGPPSHDLVITHFFLDCLTTGEVRSLAAAILPSLVPEARWVVSEFAIPSGGFGRFVAAPLVWALYRAFGFLTGLGVRRLPDHHAALGDAGFHLAASRTWLRGLLASELWILSPGEPRYERS
jgi:SAM-dependent methyltransferase